MISEKPSTTVYVLQAQGSPLPSSLAASQLDCSSGCVRTRSFATEGGLPAASTSPDRSGSGHHGGRSMVATGSREGGSGTASSSSQIRVAVYCGGGGMQTSDRTDTRPHMPWAGRVAAVTTSSCIGSLTMDSAAASSLRRHRAGPAAAVAAAAALDAASGASTAPAGNVLPAAAAAGAVQLEAPLVGWRRVDAAALASPSAEPRASAPGTPSATPGSPADAGQHRHPSSCFPQPSPPSAAAQSSRNSPGRVPASQSAFANCGEPRDVDDLAVAGAVRALAPRTPSSSSSVLESGSARGCSVRISPSSIVTQEPAPLSLTAGTCRTFTIGSVGSLPWVVPASPPSLAATPTAARPMAFVRLPASAMSASRDGSPAPVSQVRSGKGRGGDGAGGSREAAAAGVGCPRPFRERGGDAGLPTALRHSSSLPLGRLHPNVRFPAGARLSHPLQDHDYCYDVYYKLVVSSAKALLPARMRQKKHPRKGVAGRGGAGRGPCLPPSRPVTVDRSRSVLEKCVPRLKRKYERRKSPREATGAVSAALPRRSDEQSPERKRQQQDTCLGDRELMSQYKIPKSRWSSSRRPSLRDEYVYFGGTKLKSRTRNLDRKENEEPVPQPFYSSQALYWSGVPAAALAAPLLPPAPLPIGIPHNAVDAPLCLGSISKENQQHAIDTLDISTVLPSLGGIGDEENRLYETVMAVDDDDDLAGSDAYTTEAVCLEETVSTEVTGSGSTAAAAALPDRMPVSAAGAAGTSIDDLLSSMTEAEIKQVVQALGANLDSCCGPESAGGASFACNRPGVAEATSKLADDVSTAVFASPAVVPDGEPGASLTIAGSSCSSCDGSSCDCHAENAAATSRAESAAGMVSSVVGCSSDTIDWQSSDVLPRVVPPAADPTVSSAAASVASLPATVVAPVPECDSAKFCDAAAADASISVTSSHTPQVVPLQMFWNTFPALQIDAKRYVRLVDIHRQALPSKDTGLLKRRAAALGFIVDNCSELQRNLLVRYAFASPSRSTLIVDERAAEAVIASYLEPQGLRVMTAAAKRGVVGPVEQQDADTDLNDHSVSCSAKQPALSARQPPAAEQRPSSSTEAAGPSSSHRPCIVAVMPRRGRPPIRRPEQAAAVLPSSAAALHRSVRRDSPKAASETTVVAVERRRAIGTAMTGRRRGASSSALTLLRKQKRPSVEAPSAADDSRAVATDARLPARAQRLRQVKSCYRRFLNLRPSAADTDSTVEELSDRGYQSGDSSPVFAPSSVPTPCSTSCDDQAAETSVKVVADQVGTMSDLDRCPSTRCTRSSEMPTANVTAAADQMSSAGRASESVARCVDVVCGCQFGTFGYVHKARLDVQLCSSGDTRCLQCSVCKLRMTASVFAQHRHNPVNSGDDEQPPHAARRCSLSDMRPWPASPTAVAAWQSLVQQRPCADEAPVAVSRPHNSVVATDGSSSAQAHDDAMEAAAGRRSCRVHKDKQLHPIEMYDYGWAKHRRTSGDSAVGDGLCSGQTGSSSYTKPVQRIHKPESALPSGRRRGGRRQ